MFCLSLTEVGLHPVTETGESLVLSSLIITSQSNDSKDNVFECLQRHSWVVKRQEAGEIYNLKGTERINTCKFLKKIPWGKGGQQRVQLDRRTCFLLRRGTKQWGEVSVTERDGCQAACWVNVSGTRNPRSAWAEGPGEVLTLWDYFLTQLLLMGAGGKGSVSPGIVHLCV